MEKNKPHNITEPELFKQLKKLQLTTEEKLRGREQLKQFITKAPLGSVRANALGAQPFLVLGMRVRVAMPIFVIIFLTLGGSVSAAAQNALPGDILYPVKLAVNERVRSALAVSTEQQARLEVKLADVRLREAEQLAAKSDLNPTAQAAIAAGFEKRAVAVERQLEKLEAKGKIVAAANVNSELESSLDAHEAILVAIGEKQNLKAVINPLVVKVKGRSSAAAKERGQVEIKLREQVKQEKKEQAETVQALRSTEPKNDNKQKPTPTRTPKATTSTSPSVAVTTTPTATLVIRVQAAAEGALKAAQNKQLEVGRFMEAKRGQADAEAIARAELQLKLAAEILAAGKVQMEAGVYDEAFILFHKALRLNQSAKLILQAEADFKLSH